MSDEFSWFISSYGVLLGSMYSFSLPLASGVLLTPALLTPAVLDVTEGGGGCNVGAYTGLTCLDAALGLALGVILTTSQTAADGDAPEIQTIYV